MVDLFSASAVQIGRSKKAYLDKFDFQQSLAGLIWARSAPRTSGLDVSPGLLSASPFGTGSLVWPALKRVIRVETLSQSAKALVPPHKCGGSHLEFGQV
jgi:hypothetical protein